MLDAVLSAVSAESGIDVRSLLDKARFAYLVRPRQLAMVIMRERCKASWGQIGLEMDRDLSTIQEGYQSARKRLRADPDYRDLHDRVVSRLRAHQN